MGVGALNTLAAELEQSTGVLAVVMDVADCDAGVKLVEQAQHRFGRIDVLVNNAGLLGYFIARLLGERGVVFLLGETDLERTRHFYERWGFACIAFGRAIGGPAEYLVVVSGLTRIPFRTVFLAILTGAYSAAFCMSLLGA